MLNSYYTPLTAVDFPDYAGRQLRMYQFNPHDCELPEWFKEYEPIIRSLIDPRNVEEQQAFVTIDERVVEAGTSQRRPGVHVDGIWQPAVRPTWCQPRPSWCQSAAGKAERMTAIVASTYPGCQVYPGMFDAEPMDDGDLEHIRQDLGDGQLLPAGMGFELSPDCVHESLSLPETTQRSFLRILYFGRSVSSWMMEMPKWI